LNYIAHAHNKIKKLWSHRRDPRVLYGLSVVMFVFGLIIGANFFGKDNSSSQIEVAIIDQDAQPQDQLLDQPQPASQEQESQQPLVQDQPQASSVTTSQVSVPQHPVDNTKSFNATVRQKDTLTKIFKRNGLDIKDAKSILNLKQAKSLRQLRAGKKINLTTEKTKTGIKLKKLVYVINELDTLTVVAHNKGWSAKIKHIKPTVKLSYASATVRGSVYTAASKNGVPRKVVAQLANIFSKKANFKKMRAGDHFAVVYKELIANGKKIKDGEVVAAELVHNKKVHRMIAFTDPKGNTDYYTPNGYNSKAPFARCPLTSYDRIGSRFSLSRYHPILAFSRPHLGVDFVARSGTPIKATSNGKIEFVGTRGGYGRTVIIKKDIYKTLYAHLSRFAGDIHAGSYVKQGQVIGYVGASGLATGSHLHYEFHVNGVHRDPLSVKLPEGEMIAPEYRKQFFALSKRMLAQLDLHKSDRRMLAMNSNIQESKS